METWLRAKLLKDGLLNPAIDVSPMSYITLKLSLRVEPVNAKIEFGIVDKTYVRQEFVNERVE